MYELREDVPLSEVHPRLVSVRLSKYRRKGGTLDFRPDTIVVLLDEHRTQLSDVSSDERDAGVERRIRESGVEVDFLVPLPAAGREFLNNRPPTARRAVNTRQRSQRIFALKFQLLRARDGQAKHCLLYTSDAADE